MNRAEPLPSRTKAELRSYYLKILDGMNSTERSDSGKTLLAALVPLLPLEGLILSFAPLQSEIDLWPQNRELASQRRLVLPRLENGEIVLYRIDALSKLIASRLGIREPDPSYGVHVSVAAIKLALVPGIAFDQDKRRLGRGKGHYDRLLALMPHETLKIGIGFKQQLSNEAIPVEAHDIPMDRLLIF